MDKAIFNIEFLWKKVEFLIQHFDGNCHDVSCRWEFSVHLEENNCTKMRENVVVGKIVLT